MSEIISSATVGSAAVSAGGDAPALTSFVLPARRIGRRAYVGRSVTARALHVTYQQKLFVSGYIAPTVGAIWDGTGAVFGAGGSIGSQNESVVTVVHVDERGVEGTTELPSGTSLREGSIFRMDYLGDSLFAVRNLSGNQGTRFLRSPANYIPGTWFKKRDWLCGGIAALALQAGRLEFALLFLARPAWVAWRKVESGRQRRELGEYMALVAS